MKKIKDIKELKKLAAKEGGLDCFIILGGGIAKSSKHITWDGKKFCVFNEIDGTEQELTEKQLMGDKLTNVGKALKLGALINYE